MDILAIICLIWIIYGIFWKWEMSYKHLGSWFLFWKYSIWHIPAWLIIKGVVAFRWVMSSAVCCFSPLAITLKWVTFIYGNRLTPRGISVLTHETDSVFISKHRFEELPTDCSNQGRNNLRHLWPNDDWTSGWPGYSMEERAVFSINLPGTTVNETAHKRISWTLTSHHI